MALKTTKNGSEQPKQRLFFRRTLKGVYLDFLGTGIMFTMLNFLGWWARRRATAGSTLAFSPMVFWGIFMLGVSIIAYCVNYSIIVKEGRIRAKFKTFILGFLMNTMIFVLNLLLWILL
ncbi:MAG: hypothetical protein E7666_03075 [Ruminococcaceae bacterium]|nr:hypothetical protein [Oscillospiraceae bacterium]